jgi:hypothetical protein
VGASAGTVPLIRLVLHRAVPVVLVTLTSPGGRKYLLSLRLRL